MRIQTLDRDAVLRSLITSESGLSDAEAAKRLGEYGLNEIQSARGRPLYLRLLSQFAHFLAVLLCIAAGLSFVSEYLHPGEGMLPTVTLALAMGSQRMARRKALIKTLTSVETLGSVTVICTDKTGTLTQNRMAAVRVWFDGVTHDMRDTGADDITALMTVAALCSNAREVHGEYRGEPTEAALLKVAREHVGDPGGEREIPFNPERKRMTTVLALDGRTVVFTKGAIEALLPRCSHLLKKEGESPMDDALRQEVTEACHAMMDKGLRVLCFARRDIAQDEVGTLTDEEIEDDMVLVGLIGLEDPPRPEVPEAVVRCRAAGIKVIMITGDGSRTAAAIAKEIGLVRGDPAVIEGAEMDAMSEGDLGRKLKAPEIVFARMTPKHKMRVASALKDIGEIVAVTGDGVNDAPALKKADIGIAMGVSGTDVAKEAADVVLLDDNFATIVNAVEEGRAVFENIRKFITYIFASNIPEAVPYLAYILLKIPLPLTVMQILAVDLGTDMLPALALGSERPVPGIMKQPPRPPRERLIDRAVIMRAYLFLGPLEAAACMFGYFWVMYQGGWQWGGMASPGDDLYRHATTACLTAIVISQIGNGFACRSSRESVLTIGLLSNRLLLVSVGVELALLILIVYTPVGNTVFGTAPLGIDVWLVLLPFSIALLAAEEVRKCCVRRVAGAGQ